MNSSRRAVADYLRSQRSKLDLSQRQLADLAGVSSANISRLEKESQALTHEMAEVIADALQIDPLRLKALAGLRTVTPPAERDSRIEYIAQKLDEMDPRTKDIAIEMIAPIVDGLYQMHPAGVAYQTEAPTEAGADEEMAVDAFIEEHGVLSPDEELQRVLRFIKHRDPELFEMLERGEGLEE